MLERWVFNGLAALALGAMAGAAAFFVTEYRNIERRERALAHLSRTLNEEGPCAALAEARALRQAEPFAAGMVVSIDQLRRRFWTDVVGDDLRGVAALAGAEEEGLIDRRLCEQIHLSQQLGEPHPVYTLLRYTRQGGDPCNDGERLVGVLRGLGSHKPVMLHALMKDVAHMACLEPEVAHALARDVVQVVREQPRAMDDLDRYRLASFVFRWAPEEAAQFACRVEVTNRVSALANAIGCGPEARERLLPRYRYSHPLPQPGGAGPLPAGSFVLLLARDTDRCEVMTSGEGATVHTVACGDLALASDLHLAVRIEPVTYGTFRADLIAGLASFRGDNGRVERPGDKPPFRTWFAYNRRGQALGAVDNVDISALAEQAGERVPKNPLRTFCRNSGARYCYDVDWAEVVRSVPGEPTVFLSRPVDDIFLPEVPLLLDEQAALIEQAFGAPAPDAMYRAVRLDSGELMVMQVYLDGVDLRWRERGQWQKQSFGRQEGGQPAPSARLLAALDLEGDGRPELVVQRTERTGTPGNIRDVSDEVVLLSYNTSKNQFTPVNRLTVHEY